MCAVIKTEESEISTVGELIAFLGSDLFVVADEYSFAKRTSCLCQVNVPETLTEHGIKYTIDDLGDYLITS